MGNTKSCAAIWFSGFFGLAAAVHIVRLILKFPVVIRGTEIPMNVSLVVAIVASGLSLGLLFLACKKSCCDKK